MRRYYLSKIKGAGTIEDPYRHRLQEISEAQGIEFTGGEIAVDGSGVPLHPAVLLMVSGISHAGLVSDSELIPLPNVALDSKAASIATGLKVATKARIRDELGYSQTDVDAVWGNADAFAAVLDHYGKLNNPGFDSNAFDLTDL